QQGPRRPLLFHPAERDSELLGVGMGLGWARRWRTAALAALALLAPATLQAAGDQEKPVARHYVTAPPSPLSQGAEDVAKKTESCLACPPTTDRLSMHQNPAVRLGCTDCHGGDPAVAVTKGLPKTDPRYVAARDKAHVLPRYPKTWGWPSSANPKQAYTLL